MIFTKEQIDEIRERLLLSSVKDTSLPSVDLPMTGEETIPIVQQGENKRVPIDTFYDEFGRRMSNSARTDIFNVSKYAQSAQGTSETIALSLTEAIDMCPNDIRKAGQIITFLSSDSNKWETWQYTSSVNTDWDNTDYWSLESNAVINNIDGAKSISINYTIDTRDATSSSNNHLPNIDALYGPYNSKQEAWTKLSTPNASGVTALVKGKTVGIIEDGSIVEYWFESACNSIDDLVKKNTSTDIETEVDDLTMDGNTLRLANRSNENGMGYVILRTDKTFAEQVTEDNTIYEIRYEFNISDGITDDTITLPENIELRFAGGSLKKSDSIEEFTLVGNLTSIVAPPVKIFNGITIAGSWRATEAFPEWFGAVGDSVSNDTDYIKKCLKEFKTVTIIGQYLIGTIEIPENAELHFCKGLLKNGTLIGNLTSIIAPPVKIFDSITISGTWNVSMAFAEWFGAPARGNVNYDPSNDNPTTDPVTGEIVCLEIEDTPYIQRCINAFGRVDLINNYLISTVKVGQHKIVEAKNQIYVRKGGKGIWLNDKRSSYRGGFIYVYPDATAITIGSLANNSDNIRRVVVENTRISHIDGQSDTIDTYGIKLIANSGKYNTFLEIRNVNIFYLAHGLSGNVRSSLIDITVEQCAENVRIDGDLNNIRIVGQACPVRFDYNHFIYLNGTGNVLIATIYDVGSVHNGVAYQKYAVWTNRTGNTIYGVSPHKVDSTLEGITLEGIWNRYKDVDFGCFHIIPNYTYELENCTRVSFAWRIIGDSSDALDSKYTELVDTSGEDAEMDALHALFNGYYDSTDSQYEGTIADLNADTNIKIQDMRFKAIQFGSITDLDGTEPITTGKWVAYVPVLTNPLGVNLFQPKHDTAGYISLYPTSHTEIIDGEEKTINDEGTLTINIGTVIDFIEFASYCLSSNYAFDKIELYSGDTLLETSLKGSAFRNNIAIRGQVSANHYFEKIVNFKVKLYFTKEVRLKKLALYALTVPKPTSHGDIDSIPAFPNVMNEQQYLLEDIKQGNYRNAILTYLNDKWYLPNGYEWTGKIDDVSCASFKKTINGAGEYKTLYFETNRVTSPKFSSILMFIGIADTNSFSWGIFRVSALGVGGSSRTINLSKIDGDIAGTFKAYYKYIDDSVKVVVTCSTTKTSGAVAYNLISSVSTNFAEIKDTQQDYSVDGYNVVTISCLRPSGELSYYTGQSQAVKDNLEVGTEVYDTDNKRVILWNGTDWVKPDGMPLGLSGSARPSSPIAGQTFFDTSLSPKKMIVYNGTDWVNLDGTALT